MTGDKNDDDSKTVVVVVVVAPAAAYVSDFEPHSRCRDRIFIPEISKNSIRYDIVVIKLLFPKFRKILRARFLFSICTIYIYTCIAWLRSIKHKKKVISAIRDSIYLFYSCY